MSLTAGQVARAGEVIAEVRRTYAAARAVVWPAAEGWFATDAARAVKKQLDDQAARAENWATAELGQVNSGTLAFSRWLEFGEVYARFAATAGKDAYNATLFAVVADTVTESAKDAAELAITVVNPLAWPTWAKVTAGVVALVVVLYVAAPYARAAGVAK